MRFNHLSVEEVKGRSLELLGTDDLTTVDYITEEWLSGEFVELKIEDFDSKSVDILTWYGHQMAYGWANDEQAYLFKAGQNPSRRDNACGNGSWWCVFRLWDHYTTSEYCGSGEANRIIRFVNPTA